MKLRRLTAIGIERFAEFLDLLHADPTRLLPTALLEDSSCSEIFGKPTEVHPKIFGSRYAAAEYLDAIVMQSNVSEVERDVGLWTWLTLFFFDELCPASKDGGRSPGARPRYIPEPENFRRYYRHLLAGPFLIYKAHRDNAKRAMAVLCQPLDKPGDVVEQLASRLEYVSNPAVMEVATKMYVDPQTKRLKRGSQSDNGGAERLSKVLDQFDVTWDLYATEVPEFFRILPREFERFRQSTP